MVDIGHWPCSEVTISRPGAAATAAAVVDDAASAAAVCCATDAMLLLRSQMPEMALLRPALNHTTAYPAYPMDNNNININNAMVY